MANIINITERGNRLDITDTYTPIVCGNSNYELVFDFSDEWKECNNKTAVFFVNGKKTMVDFTGNVVTVPILPNAPYVHVALTTSNSANAQLSTTSLRLRLESTPLLDEMKEFDPLKNYLTSLLGTINSLESGDISVSSAKFAENVSNPNLLINGNFAVNQRGSTTYSCTGNTYTVDRWMGFSGLSVTKTDGGVTLSNTSSSGGWFQQKLENDYLEFAGKAVTISAEVNGNFYSVSGVIPETEPSSQIDLIRTDIGDNGGANKDALRLTYLNGRLVFNFYLYANSIINLSYAKLEYGETATKFTPRLYAEELALCQRYYQKITGSSTYQALGTGFATTSTRGDVFVPTPVVLRTRPTLTVEGSFRVYFGGTSTTNNNFTISNDGYTTNGIYISCNLTSTSYTAGSALLLRIEESGASISADAEIY